MTETLYNDETAIQMQQKVLADANLSNDAKLMFCRMICKTGFRYGWLLSNTRWNQQDYQNLDELENAGYIRDPKTHNKNYRRFHLVIPLPKN